MRSLRVALAPVVLVVARCLVAPVVSAAPDSADEPWPYNLPAHVKYWPEDELRMHQGWRRTDDQRPPALARVGVRKMPEDPGAKFYLDYWVYGGVAEPREQFLQPPREQAGQPDTREQKRSTEFLRRRAMDEDENVELTNGTIARPFLPPYLVHTDQQHSLNPHFKRDVSVYASALLRSPRAALKALQKRAFQCPSGTSDCSAVGRPDNCCAEGETCQVVQNAGTEEVGCCPTAGGCSGSVGSCDSGYTGCGGELGGGCCIPLYVCVEGGCGPGPSLTAVVVVTPTVTTTLSRPSTSSSSAPSSSTAASITEDESTSVTTSTAAGVSTAPQTTLACSSGFRACPVSLGGGCCRTDRACGPSECPASETTSASSSSSSDSSTLTSSSTTTTTSTSTESTTTSSSSTSSSSANTFIAPIRPTSLAESSSDPNVQTSTMTAADDDDQPCPTGFYECEAFYRGGCCRIGRNCDSTSCPEVSSTTLQTRNGVTIVVPATTPTSSPSSPSSSSSSPADATTSTSTDTSPAPTGLCATGWTSCPATLSGGCCPTGFACDLANCRASSTGIGVPATEVGKIPPVTSGAGRSSTAAAAVRRVFFLFFFKGEGWAVFLVLLVVVVVVEGGFLA